MFATGIAINAHANRHDQSMSRLILRIWPPMHARSGFISLPDDVMMQLSYAAGALSTTVSDWYSCNLHGWVPFEPA
jgi:hypothetical protein